MGVTAPECVICAWRATCNLKFMYEGSSSLHCPEFTKDVSIDKKQEIAPAPLTAEDTEKTEQKPD